LKNIKKNIYFACQLFRQEMKEAVSVVCIWSWINQTLMPNSHFLII